MVGKILSLFNIKSNEHFQLQMLEAIGNLVLMLHWQRGIIDALIRSDTIHLDGQPLSNWQRVIKNLELYEEFTWEIAPSRVMLLALRQLRVMGSLDGDIEVLMAKDPHGRIPYRLETKELDDIEDLIRKLKDARQLTGFGHGLNL